MSRFRSRSCLCKVGPRNEEVRRTTKDGD
jgi:hypothetical protein